MLDEQIRDVISIFNFREHIRPFSGCIDFQKRRILRFLGNGMEAKLTFNQASDINHLRFDKKGK